MSLFPSAIKSVATAFAVTFLFCGCTKNESPSQFDGDDPFVATAQYPGVQQELVKFFESFEEEGKSRGVDVDLSSAGITGVIEPINEANVAGQCTYYSHLSNHVTVDESFWNASSERFREFIVFHELGHCFLLRNHDESAFSNGICKSIMRSGTGNCYDGYTETTRSYYLDELFEVVSP